jgi:hypothetical protein
MRALRVVGLPLQGILSPKQGGRKYSRKVRFLLKKKWLSLRMGPMALAHGVGAEARSKVMMAEQKQIAKSSASVAMGKSIG